MDYLAEKFARLGTDNAPGQEGLQKAEELPMIGDKLEGPAVDFSHGDVNAHQPIPGSLETFVNHYCATFPIRFSFGIAPTDFLRLSELAFLLSPITK